MIEDEITPEQRTILEAVSHRQDQAAKDASLEADRHLQRSHERQVRRAESRGRIMVLAVGTAGIVVPLLATSDVHADAQWLRYATLLLLLSVIAGVLIELIRPRLHDRMDDARTKTTYVATLARVRDVTQAMTGIQSEDYHAIEAGAKKTEDDFNRRRMNLRRFDLVADVAFFGLLVFALAALSIAVLW